MDLGCFTCVKETRSKLQRGNSLTTLDKIDSFEVAEAKNTHTLGGHENKRWINPSSMTLLHDLWKERPWGVDG